LLKFKEEMPVEKRPLVDKVALVVLDMLVADSDKVLLVKHTHLNAHANSVSCPNSVPV
jgi:hypothetical protein